MNQFCVSRQAPKLSIRFAIDNNPVLKLTNPIKRFCNTSYSCRIYKILNLFLTIKILWSYTCTICFQNILHITVYLNTVFDELWCKHISFLFFWKKNDILHINTSSDEANSNIDEANSNIQSNYTRIIRKLCLEFSKSSFPRLHVEIKYFAVL